MVNCQVKKGPSSKNVTINPGNSESEAGVVRLADEKKVTQDTEEKKKSIGGTIVITDDIVNSSVEDRDAIKPTVSYADEVTRLDNEVANLPKLHGNTFKCLAQSEEEETAKSIVSSRSDPNNNSEFSDTSPVLDTFKHVKRVDELEFTPMPISRKKLKKLKK